MYIIGLSFSLRRGVNSWMFTHRGTLLILMLHSATNCFLRWDWACQELLNGLLLIGFFFCGTKWSLFLVPTPMQRSPYYRCRLQRNVEIVESVWRFIQLCLKLQYSGFGWRSTKEIQVMPQVVRDKRETAFSQHDRAAVHQKVSNSVTHYICVESQQLPRKIGRNLYL